MVFLVGTEMSHGREAVGYIIWASGVDVHHHLPAFERGHTP